MAEEEQDSIGEEDSGNFSSLSIDDADDQLTEATDETCVSLPSSSPRSKQRQFVTGRLQNLKNLDAKVYSEIVVQPILQFFLANICDLEVDASRRKRLGLRYAQTPEVQDFAERLKKTKLLRQEIADADPNVIISVLKQILTDFPGGIFDDRNEEFLCVSLKSSLELALDFVKGLIEALPIFLRQFTFLVCKALRNLARQSSGNLTDSYTDLLLLFTPVLFPNSVDDVSRFLRATRITLILVDMCDNVFRPFLDQSNLTDSAYHSDDDFFADVLNTLNQLQNSFHVSKDEDDDSGNENEFWLDFEVNPTPNVSNNNNEYYQITYM
ncbi:Rho GTPase-activating protein domain and Rho GTPase activation protein domain-containing protein [Aphelenchoides bicaudatus]|nr:Rho GTPase-activating protein domain and Rho GTPase activation protein domain-containing protein [Aphelenchoides bicaudatus]